MKFRALGSTGLSVSEIGMGCWAIGGDQFGNSYGPTDDDVSLAAIRKAVDMGVAFFDTADVYGHGHSEELLGKALANVRDRVFIATKVGYDFYQKRGKVFDEEYVRFALEQSLKRLGTNYIDLYQMHNPSLAEAQSENVCAVFRELKKEGLIRHWGISIHDPKEGVIAIKTTKPETIQVAYNIFNQSAAQELFAVAKENGVGIIAREPLANGFLSGKYDETSTFQPGDVRNDAIAKDTIVTYVRMARRVHELLNERKETLAQLALKFVLQHDAVSVAIPGAKTPEQAEENAMASDVMPLQTGELARLRGLYAA
ncbi:MAG: aldo/keto reductase [Candidatus Aenigmatarchaeota archaeon]|nr:MAG: aldo/keto reductase [Candidatus Aenigmarchaeota archaeon]